ncbi:MULTISPECIES: endonuclease domain-containing protein [unclassified Variovorax]|jgi:very-short-patch-repair endonuclease|uniref:endonuclease domain-containing protein n=1 Tax=Variovorax TaxID=34072 RepID=UPI00214C9E68|nr:MULTISPECIES: endonuclease domain-containing protein [unclassified Variovorax]MDM0090067.1 endonuclease domain-containing protein [Variovorax sp. J22G40]MDM0148267.1 endonuclease domain-containing protein [Variovorax sp. J2P1-31]
MQPMQNQSTSKAQQNARVLRRGMTDAERRLWSGLRNEQLGVKFRRQHPLGHYIADFACLGPKLIVELDGSQHQAQQDHDARRDTFLRAQGFEVLRFGSNDPFVNLEGVLQVIVNRIDELTAACPHPNLPPEGEGATSRSSP